MKVINPGNRGTAEKVEIKLVEFENGETSRGANFNTTSSRNRRPVNSAVKATNGPRRFDLGPDKNERGFAPLFSSPHLPNRGLIYMQIAGTRCARSLHAAAPLFPPAAHRYVRNKRCSTNTPATGQHEQPFAFFQLIFAHREDIPMRIENSARG